MDSCETRILNCSLWRHRGPLGQIWIFSTRKVVHTRRFGAVRKGLQRTQYRSPFVPQLRAGLSFSEFCDADSDWNVWVQSRSKHTNILYYRKILDRVHPYLYLVVMLLCLPVVGFGTVILFLDGSCGKIDEVPCCCDSTECAHVDEKVHKSVFMVTKTSSKFFKNMGWWRLDSILITDLRIMKRGWNPVSWILYPWCEEGRLNIASQKAFCTFWLLSRCA